MNKLLQKSIAPTLERVTSYITQMQARRRSSETCRTPRPRSDECKGPVQLLARNQLPLPWIQTEDVVFSLVNEYLPWQYRRAIFLPRLPSPHKSVSMVYCTSDQS